MPKRIQLTEARTMGGPADTMTGGILKVALITPGWGTSGFYSAQVLEAAAKAKVFPAGLHMYLDHQGEYESFDRARVGRSIRDLAAVLTTDATWNGNALVAEAQVFPPYRDALGAMAEAIGVSIRGDAEMEVGEAEGKRGVIITELVKGTSADFVTHAGRGGQILAVLESARTSIEDAFTPTASLIRLIESRNVGQWIESRMHLDFTQQADDMFGDGRLSREERIAMSGAVGDALDAFTTSLEASAPQLYTRDLWEDPQVIADTIEAAFTKTAGVADGVKCKTCGHMASAHKDIAAGDNMGACAMKGCDCPAMKTAAKESATPTNVPAPAGQPKSEEDKMAMTQVEEAELSRLTEAAGRVQTAENERDTARTERDAAVTEADTLREAANTQTRLRVVREAADAAGVTLDQWQIAGLSADAPIGQDHRVDEAALRTRADTAIATIAEAAGAGRVTNFGHTSTNQGEVSEADLDTILADAFGRTPVKEA